MKTLRIKDFDPHAPKEPALKSTLEHFPRIEKPHLPRQVPETQKAGFHEITNSGIPETLKEGKPESRESRKPVTLKAGKPDFTKAEKYSTQLDPKLKKRLQVYALEHDLKDYEVIETALIVYLDQHTPDSPKP